MYEIEYEMFEDLISKNPSIFDGKELVFISHSNRENTELRRIIYQSAADMSSILASIKGAHGRNIRSTGSKLQVQVNEVPV